MWRALSLLLLLAGAAHAQSRPDPRLLEAERARQQAEAAAQRASADARAAATEAQRLAERRVLAAAGLRTVEAEVARRAEEVATLEAARADSAARLAARAAAIAPLLPLLQRLAARPAETLLAAPGPADETVRALIVLRGLTRRLGREAEALRTDQAALDARLEALADATPRLRAALATQAAEAATLDTMLAQAQSARQRADESGAEALRRVAAEAARADGLRAALAALEAGRARAEAQARDDAARADRSRQADAAQEARRREATLARPAGPGPTALVPPVSGTVARAWGDSTDAGPATGITWRPGPQARVVAPCAGRVRFAGPFRSFGALIILDCGGGYAVVLAGLERIDLPAGAAVLTGEPVGIMPAWPPGGGPRPALYVELRHDGQAVNPAPFLRGRL